MGCDIHICTEARNRDPCKSRWLNVDRYKLDEYEQEKGNRVYVPVEICDGRNYTMFAMLADVRNSYGIIPISQPRGIPEDANEVTLERSERYGIDGHSHSYLTLKELKEYNAKKSPVTYTGYVSPDDAIIVDMGGVPKMWCSMTNDPTWVKKSWTVIPDDLDDLIKNLQERKVDTLWLWHSPEDERDEDIRIVFWFDN